MLHGAGDAVQLPDELFEFFRAAEVQAAIPEKAEGQDQENRQAEGQSRKNDGDKQRVEGREGWCHWGPPIDGCVDRILLRESGDKLSELGAERRRRWREKAVYCRQLKVESGKKTKKEFYTEDHRGRRGHREYREEGTMPSKLRPRNRAPTRRKARARHVVPNNRRQAAGEFSCGRGDGSGVHFGTTPSPSSHLKKERR